MPPPGTLPIFDLSRMPDRRTPRAAASIMHDTPCRRPAPAKPEVEGWCMAQRPRHSHTPTVHIRHLPTACLAGIWSEWCINFIRIRLFSLKKHRNQKIYRVPNRTKKKRYACFTRKAISEAVLPYITNSSICILFHKYLKCYTYAYWKGTDVSTNIMSHLTYARALTLSLWVHMRNWVNKSWD